MEVAGTPVRVQSLVQDGKTGLVPPQYVQPPETRPHCNAAKRNDYDIPVVAEKQHQSIPQESPNQGVNPEKQAASEPDIRSSQEGKKRKRTATNGDGDDGETTATSLQHRLIEALEKNGKLLSSQLEAQNANIQLDREQREGHMNSIITVLDKLADALGRIADKL